MQLRKLIDRYIYSPVFWAIWTGLALLMPNIMLDFTESYNFGWRLTNLILPGGLYLMLLGSNRHLGVSVLLSFPIMLFCSFQIVLIYLYGGSIIAVDMFLNVLTTNVAEATELLSNLVIAILFVVVLYLPPLVWAIVALWKRPKLPQLDRRSLLLTGSGLAVIGIFAAILTTYTTGDHQAFRRNVFPINVIGNMVEAVHRTQMTVDYPITSSSFDYQAHSLRDSAEQEIYVLVIGETSRAINWQLAGYDRPTNPKLSKESNLTFFDRAISQSNTTHKSVPMIMSFATAENFDSINYYKSILTAMKQAGFKTWFLSNQAPNHSYTQFFGEEADSVKYFNGVSSANSMCDTDMLPDIAKAIADSTANKKFIVVHSYGSHFLYGDRYKKEFERFKPCDNLDAKAANRTSLINAYDNSIVATDSFLADIIDMLRDQNCLSFMIYSSDHGEDIFDDSRGRFLHASPTPTYYQLHVAMCAWMSDQLAATLPGARNNLSANSADMVSPQESIFPTLLDVAGVESPYVNHHRSLVRGDYRPNHLLYLTDLNQPVPLIHSGLKKIDKKMFNQILPESHQL